MNTQNNLVSIYAGNNYNVELLKEILLDNEIVALSINEAESGRLAGFAAPSVSIDLYVNKEDEEKAKELVKAFHLA
jgi:hypothetical protein